MEGGSLFNPGFLGGSFLWWVGQIADDSVWRDNNLTGKYENKDTPEGWGRRYKVRIIGIHDQGETEIPSDQLPWAQIMYPVTAGGGQASSGQTSNLRQGMMVFGFFLDSQDQQIPVIMGVLGNNSQTPLATSIGNNRVTNAIPGTLATSGHATGQIAKSEKTKDKAPDVGLTTKKPKSRYSQRDEATLAKLKREPEVTGNNPTVALRNSPVSYSSTYDYLDPTLDRSLDATLAREDAVVAEYEARKKKKKALQDKLNQENSPEAPAEPGATLEQVDSPHQMSAGEVKLQERLEQKIPMMKPDPDQKVQSAMKSMQTVIETLTQKIDKYLSTIRSYIDQVSSVITNIRSAISSAAFEASKYMKIMMDKVMEYMMKILNEAMSPIISALPSSMRFMMLDLKETIVELIRCLYCKITDGLFGMLEGILSKAFDISALEQIARNPNTAGTSRKNPKVPVCYAEGVVGQALAGNASSILDFSDGLLDNVNTFLDDIDSMVAGVSGGLGDISNLMGGLTGNITSAMNFSNIKLNVFGCELSPNIAVSDFYTLATGGGGTPEQQLPSEKSVADSANTAAPADSPTQTPFIQPTSETPDVDISKSEVQVTTTDPETGVITKRDDLTPAEKQARADQLAEADGALDIY